MATFTNVEKNTVTATNEAKNTSTFLNEDRDDGLYYITTDTPDFVLVGSSEDEFLVWSCPVEWSNLIKS